MQPFRQQESGYTPTAYNVTLPSGAQVDLSKLWNPERRVANAAVVSTNILFNQMEQGR